MSVPSGAWDSHVHVCDEDKFPFDPNYPYRPKKADLDDLLTFEKTLGIDHVCIVAMSVYGTNNDSIVDALKRLNGKGRAVACIDPAKVTDNELKSLHEVGVRGIRVNLRTRSQTFSKEGFSKLLQANADRIRPYGWALQIYVSLQQIPLFADIVPQLGIPIVIDHIGHPHEDGTPVSQQAGYTEFMHLLATKQIYTKLSGTYRFPGIPGLDDFAREILRVAPTQVVWASDWPHSGGVENLPDGDRTKHQDFREVDDVGFVEQCREWCGQDEELIRKIWVENPRRLWQYDG